MLGESKNLLNPGFWSDRGTLEIDDLKSIRILVCGNTGVGKSTLINRVFGVVDPLVRSLCNEHYQKCFLTPHYRLRLAIAIEAITELKKRLLIQVGQILFYTTLVVSRPVMLVKSSQWRIL